MAKEQNPPLSQVAYIVLSLVAPYDYTTMTYSILFVRFVFRGEGGGRWGGEGGFFDHVLYTRGFPFWSGSPSA